MNTNGIMEEIRSLLNEGRSSTEVIALGYAPSSVYKAQRQLRKATDRTDQPVTQVLVTNLPSEGWSELREENAKLCQQVSLLEEVKVERDTLGEELELAQSRIEELEAKASQAQQLRDRLAAIEPEARAAGELRREVNELDHQIKHTNATMAQEVHRWKGRFEKEGESRQTAEVLAAKRNSEMQQLRTENQRLTQEMQQMPDRISAKVWEMLQPFKQELEELRLLKVWAGHPCTVCGKSTPGVPVREVAARPLREGGYAHGDCL